MHKYIEAALVSNDDAMKHEAKEIIEVMYKHLKKCDKELYKSLKMRAYRNIYGDHLCPELCEKWVKAMHNEDGTTGAHWSITDTNSVARQHSITMEHFTEHEWWATMNMIYSDYYNSLPNDITTYCKVAKAFLCDKDAKPGKLMNYYFCIAN